MKMKAVRFIETGRPAEVVDIPRPKAGPGAVDVYQRLREGKIRGRAVLVP